MDLASPSERLENAEPTLADSPLLGFVRSCPAADITVARPLQPDSGFRLAFRRFDPLVSRRHWNQPSAARFHTVCMFRPCGFSPLRRLAPRDGFECFATRASQGSLRCRRPSLEGRPMLPLDPRRNRTLTPAAPPPHHLPKQTRGLEAPFPQRGHPTKNLERQQPTTSLDATVPSCGCRPPGADPKVLPECLAHSRAFIRRRLWTLPLAVASSLAESASSHGFLFLQRSLRRPKPTGRGAETPSATEASDTLQM